MCTKLSTCQIIVLVNISVPSISRVSGVYMAVVAAVSVSVSIFRDIFDDPVGLDVPWTVR